MTVGVGVGVRYVRTVLTIPELTREYARANITCRASNNNITAPLRASLHIELYSKWRSSFLHSGLWCRWAFLGGRLWLCKCIDSQSEEFYYRCLQSSFVCCSLQVYTVKIRILFTLSIVITRFSRHAFLQLKFTCLPWSLFSLLQSLLVFLSFYLYLHLSHLFLFVVCISTVIFFSYSFYSYHQLSLSALVLSHIYRLWLPGDTLTRKKKCVETHLRHTFFRKCNWTAERVAATKCPINAGHH